MDAEEGARGGAPSTSAMYPDGTGPAADLPVFSTVLVYATSARVYVVAGTSDKSRWRILNVSRALNADDSLDASEDPGEYDEAQCARERRAEAGCDGGVRGGGVGAVGGAGVGRGEREELRARQPHGQRDWSELNVDREPRSSRTSASSFGTTSITSSSIVRGKRHRVRPQVGSRRTSVCRARCRVCLC